VQGWVDFNNGGRGVTIATPENPMLQLGNFHFAHNQSEINLERAMLLGWVTNNYWETNFPGAQPGVVTARYTILPYAGDFDESQAHRFASECEHNRPVVQHLGEPYTPSHLEATGNLLHLPQPPILVLGLRAGTEGSSFLTLYNASDVPQPATISSGSIHIKSVKRCDLFGKPLEKLPVNKGAAEVRLQPRETMVVNICWYS
jgi:alpha-mannosidase